MTNLYVVEGSLLDEWTVRLDEKAPVQGGRVQVLVKSNELPTPKRSVVETIAAIREAQKQAGFVPSTREEVDARIAEERASWD